MSSKVPIINRSELAELHTGTLMNRRKALLKCDESFELSDRFGIGAEPDSAETGFVEYKNTPEWKQAYSDLKAVLSTRENIPNKKERKAMRQEKAGRGRSG